MLFLPGLQNCHSFCESVKSCLACPVPSVSVASVMPELNYLLCPDDLFEGSLVTLLLHFSFIIWRSCCRGALLLYIMSTGHMNFACADNLPVDRQC